MTAPAKVRTVAEVIDDIRQLLDQLLQEIDRLEAAQAVEKAARA